MENEVCPATGHMHDWAQIFFPEVDDWDDYCDNCDDWRFGISRVSQARGRNA